jgi:hypothetical protein
MHWQNERIAIKRLKKILHTHTHTSCSRSHTFRDHCSFLLLLLLHRESERADLLSYHFIIMYLRRSGHGQKSLRKELCADFGRIRDAGRSGGHVGRRRVGNWAHKRPFPSAKMGSAHRTHERTTYRAALQCFCCVRPMLHVGPSVRLGSATFSRPAAGCRCPTPASDALKSSRVLARSPAPGTAHRYRCG